MKKKKDLFMLYYIANIPKNKKNKYFYIKLFQFLIIKTLIL